MARGSTSGLLLPFTTIKKGTVLLVVEVPLSSGVSGASPGDAALIVGRYKYVTGAQYGGKGFWTGYTSDDRETTRAVFFYMPVQSMAAPS